MEDEDKTETPLKTDITKLKRGCVLFHPEDHICTVKLLNCLFKFHL